MAREDAPKIHEIRKDFERAMMAVADKWFREKRVSAGDVTYAMLQEAGDISEVLFTSERTERIRDRK